MTHEDRGHYAKKHSSDTRVDEKIAETVKKMQEDGKLTCSKAFKIVKKLKVSPGEVGRNADLLEIRLCQCQLGLYGYYPQKKIVKPAKEVLEEITEAIEKEISNGKLSCKSVWNIAEKLDIPKMKVSSACEKLGVKIGPCQLGAFG
ncbi:MAG: hypothetical protein SV062_04960 [Thermodesulfobacteriota bacterium]|nr:hypothetical protein [Thermodesulfobacteriota bacterium]